MSLVTNSAASDRILWFHKPNLQSGGQFLLNTVLQKCGINYAKVFYSALEKMVPGCWVPKNKTKWHMPGGKKSEVSKVIEDLVNKIKPRIIVANSYSALFFFGGQSSLDTCRGSVYFYRGIPVVVLDDPVKIKTVRYYGWLYSADIRKLKRWYDGCPRNEPAFDYTVCDSVTDLARAYIECSTSLLVSVDIETAAKFVTSISYTCVLSDGRVRTWVIPFVDPTKPDGCYWVAEEDELNAWAVVRAIHDCNVPKAFQNGIYDSAWLLKFRVPPFRFTLDTMHLFHSIWTEAPQSLDFIAAFCCDHVRYWKHEIKGEEDAGKASRLPQTKEGMEIYWRYNGLDTYWTALAAIYLIKLITAPSMKWALDNYDIEFRAQIGPCLAMSMRGMKMDTSRQLFFNEKWTADYVKSLNILRKMVDDPTFNPNSPHQVASLIYDVLKAPKIKQRGKGGKKNERSVDEKLLKIIATRHPIFKMYIEAIWNTKKPLNNASKYGSMRNLNGRFMYQVSMKTETGRTASKEHMFWIGTNAQNIPGDARSMLVADPGYMLFDADYSQSDAFFVAFESGDPRFIQTMLGDRDSHCVHASFFFEEPYEKIFDAYKRKDPWAVHPTKGVRQNTKRIVHGSNYRMAGATLYVVMGHDAVVATAHALGHADAHNWSMKQLQLFCQSLIDAYMTRLYPRLPTWFNESVNEAIKAGNKVTVYGGRTRLFFGDLASDAAAQRELSAYFGQGGTAGNINRTLLSTYFDSNLECGGNAGKEELMLLLQTHDSITGQVPIGRFDLIDKFLTIMREEVSIREHTFRVPVECEVGFSWKAGLIAYKPGVTTMKDLENAERKLQSKFGQH